MDHAYSYNCYLVPVGITCESAFLFCNSAWIVNYANRRPRYSITNRLLIRFNQLYTLWHLHIAAYAKPVDIQDFILIGCKEKKKPGCCYLRQADKNIKHLYNLEYDLFSHSFLTTTVISRHQTTLIVKVVSCVQFETTLISKQMIDL